MDCKAGVKGKERIGKAANCKILVKPQENSGKADFCKIYVKRRQNSGEAAASRKLEAPEGKLRPATACEQKPAPAANRKRPAGRSWELREQEIDGWQHRPANAKEAR